MRKKKMFRGISTGIFVSLIILSAGFFITAKTGLAVEFDPEIGETLGLGSADLVDVILNVLRWALGILALIALIFIIYAGILWMTSGGNEEKVRKAKRILRDAIIGMVIVLLSWAIVTYVMGVMGNVTNGSPGGPIPCEDAGACYGCCQWCDPDTMTIVCPADPMHVCNLVPPCPYIPTGFKVIWTYPHHGQEGLPICTAIAVKFSEPVDTATVSNSTFKLWTGGLEPPTGVPGSWTYSDENKQVEFYPDDFLDMLVDYNLKIVAGPTGIKNDIGEQLETDKLITFSTSDEIDEDPPIVLGSDLGPPADEVFPDHGMDDVCTNTYYTVRFNEAVLPSSVHNGEVGSTVKLIKQPGEFLGDPVYSSIVSFSDPYNVLIKPAGLPLEDFTKYWGFLRGGVPEGVRDYCQNPLDGQGGPAGSPGDLPDGDNIPPDEDDYAWEFETGNDPDCEPEITSITPNQGYYWDPAPPGGTEVTINGYYFYGGGNVIFNNNVYAGDSCFDANHYPNVSCFTSWDTDKIVIKTPVGVQGNGKIKVEIGDMSAISPDNYENKSPRINWISPDHGGVSQFVTITGENFGDYVAGSSIVKFRRDAATSIDGVFPPDPPCTLTWQDDRIIITVPPGFIAPESLKVQIVTGDGYWSNLMDFNFTDEPPGPGLCQVTACGPAGGSVELIGVRFGDDGYVPGENYVHFDAYEAATHDYWDSNNITVTTQSVMENGNYNTRVKVDERTSNPMSHQIPCGESPYIVNDSTCDETVFPPIWPSPNPRQNETNVCVNAIGFARFGPEDECIGGADAGDDCLVGPDCDSGQCGIVMNGGTINTSNIILDECNIGGSFDLDECSPISHTVLFVGPNMFGVAPTAANPFTANTWYQITVKKEVESNEGARMNDDYSWHFRIKEDGGSCPLANLSVIDTGGPPSGFPDGEINYIVPPNNIENYQAIPTGEECTILDPGSYSYAWASSNEAVATVGADTDDDNTATAAGDNGNTWIRASTEGKTGSSLLTVNYCDASTDCTLGGVCPDSYCNIPLNRCTPDVTEIDPEEGAEGVCVTISGCYFGGSKGNVKFFNNEVASSEICGLRWTDSEIIAEVPAGISPGPITVTKPDGLFADSDVNFTPSANHYPCLCWIVPNTQEKGGVTDFIGDGFGDAPPVDNVWFSGAAATATYDSWINTKVDNAVVPDDAVTGPARIENDIGFSNPVNMDVFDGPVIPGAGGPCDGTPETEICEDPDDTMCHDDAHCDTTDCICAWNDFEITDYQPQDFGCTNSLIEIDFNHSVDSDSAQAKNAAEEYENITLTRGDPAVYVPGSISVFGNKVIYSPSELLEEGIIYQVMVVEGPGGVLSVHGGELATTLVWQFEVVGDCALEDIEILISRSGYPLSGPPDMFTCNANNGCDGDADPSTPGNQHFVVMLGKDNQGRTINASFTIHEINVSMSDDVLEDPLNIPIPPPPADPIMLVSRIQPKSGSDIGIVQLDVEANDDNWALPGEGSTVQTSYLVHVYICDHPWPNTPPFSDPAFHFQTYYCMDGGLPDFGTPIGISGSDELLKEYLMTPADSSDVIGIRIMKNLEHLSPAEWYNKTFPDNAGSPHSTEVDGYEAIRDGRTLYINATTVGGEIFTNMFIFSYDEEASSCNIIQNPSFEDSDHAHWPNFPNYEGWTEENFWIDGAELFDAQGVGEQVDGDYSMKIFTYHNNKGWLYQEFDDLDIGYTYNVSGWLRVDVSRGRAGLITECWGKRCVGGDDDGLMCNEGSECDSGSCIDGRVTDPECGFNRPTYPYWGGPEDIQLFGEDHPGELPWTKINYNVVYNQPGYRLRVYCILSTTEEDTGNPGGSGAGRAWWDFIQVEPEGACSSSVAKTVFDKMINNLQFNTNIPSLVTKGKLQRDTKRLGQLTKISNQLEEYVDEFGELPDLSLESGTYVGNMTTSIWPSWQARLGNVLGQGMPSDPLQTTDLCGTPYHPDTCWDEDLKIFMCCDPDAAIPLCPWYLFHPTPYIYSYVYDPDVDQVYLYTRMEYNSGLQWNCPVTRISGNICPDTSQCQVDCFNSRVDVGHLCP